MSLAIKTIPVLKDEAAENFLERVDRNSKKRVTVDFTEQAKSTRAILDRAKIRK